MILRAVYVRFYRAFNFDYLRKQHPKATPDDWDLLDDGTFYPYVTLDIDSELTAIVGANESGKSQLLQAVEHALGQRDPAPGDFCRYSEFFTVAEAMRIPHFGLYFDDLKPAEAETISRIAGYSDSAGVSSFRVFRTLTDRATLYIDNEKHEVTDLSTLNSTLPRVFRIDAHRAIPDSIPISLLVTEGGMANADVSIARTDRWKVVGPMIDRISEIFNNFQDPQALATTVQSIFADVPALGGLSDQETNSYRNQLNLAYNLLITVGGIHHSAFEQLQAALRNDDQGLANGIEASMNSQLEMSLNLSKWWSQDQRFRLAIAVRDFDIVFTIRDRTGSEYSFAERSDGLKYFLSYLVQFLAHVRDRDRPEILLMDEPDAYLSNQGQQDLLRVLQEFTRPTDDASGGQVVFVTHSPFLIDKNRGDRIRVLDKGSGEEGVRVVRDVGRNHFEPLRTALGSFVGETAFIGNCNLMLEGMADQIFLAGMSELLNREGVASTQRLDLNRITLVPAGSASQVPYMTFLARGRDANKPAVIVLLDGDQEGDRAAKDLRRGGPRDKQIIRPEYILQLKPNVNGSLTSERPGGPLDIEDLVPVEVALDATKRYLAEMGKEIPRDLPSADTVRDSLSNSTGVFKTIQEALANTDCVLHLEKIAFARHAIAVCSESKSESAKEMRTRFASLLSELTALQRKAERERELESIAARVDREKQAFSRDRLPTATKADVATLLEKIESVVDSSVEGDALLNEIRRIRHDLELHQDLSGQIVDKDALKGRLERLKYTELLASQPEAGHQSTEEALPVVDVRANAGRPPTGVNEDGAVEDAPQSVLNDQQQS